jgi:hypothetical protein
VAAGIEAAPVSDSSEENAELIASALSTPLRSLREYAETGIVTQEFLRAASPVIGEAPKKKILDGKFLLLIGLGTALTIADYEMTLRCLDRRICREANPLLPTSRAGMYATNIPLNAALYYWSYKRKATGKKLWWVAPLAIIGSHAIGVGTNVRFVGK